MSLEEGKLRKNTSKVICLPTLKSVVFGHGKLDLVGDSTIPSLPQFLPLAMNSEPGTSLQVQLPILSHSVIPTSPSTAEFVAADSSKPTSQQPSLNSSESPQNEHVVASH